MVTFTCRFRGSSRSAITRNCCCSGSVRGSPKIAFRIASCAPLGSMPSHRGDVVNSLIGGIVSATFWRAFAAFAARALAICSGEWCAGRASWTGLLTRLLTGWSFGFDFGLVDFLRRRMRCWVRSHNVVISISPRPSGPLQQSRSSEK